MKKIRRKISLEDLKTRDEGSLFGEIIADFIFMKVPLTQTIDDMGMFIDLPFLASGDLCATFEAILVVNSVNCYNPNDIPPQTGSMSVQAIGGTAPYTYIWSDGGNSSSLMGIPVGGSRSVTVTDANECSVELSGEITGVEVLDPIVTITLGYDWFHPILEVVIPANTAFPISTLDGSIFLCGPALLDAGEGNTYEWTATNSNGTYYETTQQVTVDEDGIYSVVVTDINGCAGTSEGLAVHAAIVLEPVIEITNLPPNATGSGTQSYPYVICDPTLITQEFIEFGLLNPTAYDFIKWESGDPVNEPTSTLNSASCTVESPCPQNVQVSSICDVGFNVDLLLTSNTFWFVYEYPGNGCTPLGENEGG